MKFQSKAKTLLALSGVLGAARVLPVKIVEFDDWKAQSSLVLESLRRLLDTHTCLIVRSSHYREDSLQGSNAGRFLSVGDVRSGESLCDAVERVFESYGAEKDGSHIFVQPYLQNVQMAGVIFTAEPSTGAPYYIFNYEENGSTDGITSGQSKTHRTRILNARAEAGPPFAGLIVLCQELQSLFGVPLDIEFAIANDEPYLLQVRPLLCPQLPSETARILEKRLQEVQQRVVHANRPKPFLLGAKTIFGVMPDWNPAEIIGVRPRPLALSMYKELVTDSTWAYQRDNYGYRNLRSHPLIHSLAGCPYVDVRVDFNSFVPADIEEPLAGKLVDYYLERLACHPHLHDKVEFDIIFSCYHFNIESELSTLASAGFSSDEIAALTDSLRRLTVRIIDRETGLWKRDLERIERLESRHREVISSGMDLPEKIYWLIEDCKRYGTLPFAGLARAGFIAVQMLKSLVACGQLSQDELHEFMNSLNTVSTRMSADFASLSRETFLSIYGHLRPGTYDILSARYDESPDHYFNWESQAAPGKAHSFKLSIEQYKALERSLKRHGLDLDVLSLFEFLKSAIEGREYAKFLFTRNVSDALSLLRKYGEQLGFSIEDMSFCSISSILSLYSRSGDAAELIGESIRQGRAAFEVTRLLRLPSLIFAPEDVLNFEVLDSEPNFITQLAIESELVVLQKNTREISGKIVMIENADPGFDWIFTKGIRGFITMYGGANSHMAIRANEMKIPAVVGAGQINYEKWMRAKKLRIDCCSRQVQVLQ